MGRYSSGAWRDHLVTGVATMRKKTWATGVLTGAVAVAAMAVAAAMPAASAAKPAASTLPPPPVKFLITPWNTALIISYATATANLTKIGGPADQTVINGIVQEINIKTGKVLFQWNSADHVPYGQSEQPLPSSASTPWDWFHVNAVKLARNGSLLIDARDTWTTYDVSLRTGHIRWRLGGKDSSFKVRAAPGQTL